MLGSCLTLAAVASWAQPPVKQVLMLQSFEHGILVVDHFTGEFRAGLDQRAGEPVNIVQIVVGPTGLVGAPEQAVVDYVRSSFAGQSPPDLIVTVAGPAAAFARKYRQQLFPETPLLFASVDHRWLRDSPLGANESAVTVVNDYPRLIDDILELLPETRQIFMVVGSGSLRQFWRRELEAEFARFRDRVTFLWPDDLPLSGILRQSATLPRHSAIVFLSFGTDVQRGAYADEQVLADLHAAANAPMFGALSPLLGRGVVGGRMIAVDDLGRGTAEVANRILDGEPPGTLRQPPRTANHLMFDWRELRRWGIPESRLPAGSVVTHRAPSLWAEHKAVVLVTMVALGLQSLLIAQLLIARRARRLAEIESRQNLTLAADANRRETMSALTSSIGHELGQPLSAIAHNVQALRRLLTPGEPTPGATGEILAEIQAEAVLARRIIERHRSMLRSRQLLQKPIALDAVVHESLALVSHDMAAHRIGISLDLDSTPCVIEGDAVLLQQVLVNLLRNSMDALSGTPAASRRITLRSVVGAGDVRVSVRDTGPGLPPEILEKLFTPFTTTKPDGLGVGLTITRSIVEAHGGAISAHGNPDGGATFEVTLPRGVVSKRGSHYPGTADAS